MGGKGWSLRLRYQPGDELIDFTSEQPIGE